MQKLVSKDFFWIRGDHFKGRIEYNEEFVIIHLPDLESLTKESLKELRDCLQDTWDLFTTAGYPAVLAAVPLENKVINKLAEKLKFKLVAVSDGYNIYKFEGE